jgi:hypothetical protein
VDEPPISSAINARTQSFSLGTPNKAAAAAKAARDPWLPLRSVVFVSQSHTTFEWGSAIEGRVEPVFIDLLFTNNTAVVVKTHITVGNCVVDAVVARERGACECNCRIADKP